MCSADISYNQPATFASAVHAFLLGWIWDLDPKGAKEKKESPKTFKVSEEVSVESQVILHLFLLLNST